MAKRIDFKQILEASLSELIGLQWTFNEFPETERLYAEALLSYLKGDLERLKNLAREMAGLPRTSDLDVCLRLVRLRLQIRQSTVETGLLDELRSAPCDPFWRGEVAFVLALGFGSRRDFAQESLAYKQAYAAFTAQGCARKALKSLQNHLAAESSLRPNVRFLAELLYLFKQARRLREFGMAGLALVDLSREYQKIGALRTALKFANRAVTYLERDVGTIHYYFALAHRCHVLFQLERSVEAMNDYELIRSAPFSEIRETAVTLVRMFPETLRASTPPEEELTFAVCAASPSWQERRAKLENERLRISQCFGELTEKLIFFIGEQPRTRDEIISNLYGNRLDFLILENRFKNLLARVRKKAPGLIIFHNGTYALADTDYLGEVLRRAQ